VSLSEDSIFLGLMHARVCFYGAVVEDDGDVIDPVYNDDIPDDTARFLFPSALE